MLKVDVKNTITQSQLLQRELQQNRIDTSTQKIKEVLKEEPEAYERKLSPSEEKEKIRELTDSMNDFLKPVHTSLKFEFHDKLEEYYVAIVDDSTDEVIREIPPKKMLDLYASIAESLGFIVDHKI